MALAATCCSGRFSRSLSRRRFSGLVVRPCARPCARPCVRLGVSGLFSRRLFGSPGPGLPGGAACCLGHFWHGRFRAGCRLCGFALSWLLGTGHRTPTLLSRQTSTHGCDPTRLSRAPCPLKLRSCDQQPRDRACHVISVWPLGYDHFRWNRVFPGLRYRLAQRHDGKRSGNRLDLLHN